MPLPNLIVIGAHKCGTTSFHSYLDQHPQISMSVKKELNFFVDCMNWKRGFQWYERQFRENDVVGESSVLYTRHPRGGGVPERIHQHLPGIKLIYLVRDPIERIRSHFVDVTGEWREHRPFGVVLELAMRKPEPGGYLDTSRYALQLEQYLRHFPRERIHVVFLEDLMAAPQATMQTAFRFLGVNPDYVVDFSTKKNASDTKRRLHPVVRSLVSKRILRELRYPRHTRIPDRVLLRAGEIVRRMGPVVERPVVPAPLYDELVGLLREDIGKLERLTGYLPAAWRKYLPAEAHPA
jgi:hypothetical protein